MLKRILLDFLIYDAVRKHKFGHQSIFLAGLEIDISQKLDLVYGHSGHFEKCIFFRLSSLIFFLI